MFAFNGIHGVISQKVPLLITQRIGHKYFRITYFLISELEVKQGWRYINSALSPLDLSGVSGHLFPHRKSILFNILLVYETVTRFCTLELPTDSDFKKGL
jgi:hypothetical protein